MSRDNKIEGIGSITSGSYDVVSIEGIGKVKGNVLCNELSVEGIYKGKGKVETHRFSCEGISRILKDMKAREVRIEGMVKIKGAKLEAEAISCSGMLTCTGEVSADDIFIEGICSIARMYGDKIKILSISTNKSPFSLPKGAVLFAKAYIGRRFSEEYSIIDMIECSELEAEYLECKVLKAHNIKLGPHCKVGHIECDGQLEYDETCQIGKIVADKVTKQTHNKKGEMDMADIKLTKVLDLYKEGKINADEAEKMLQSLGSVSKSVAAGTTPKFNDDKLRVVVMRDNKLISQREYEKGMTINVEYQGNVANVECWGNLTCKDVEGNASAGGNVTCGRVDGNVSAGGNAQCEGVDGNVSAGGNVTCSSVDGNINAGGGVRLSK